MRWIKIDPDNLQKGGVIAANFDTESEFFDRRTFGPIAKYSSGDIMCYCCGHLTPVTHYIDINQIEQP